jgi:predicted DNA-binding protein
MKHKSIKVDEETYNMIKEYKSETGIPLNRIVEKAIKKYIKKDSE